MRTRMEVIEAFFTAVKASKVVAIGYSCEPIATLADPDDEIEGDYALTVLVQVLEEETDKFFASPFRVTFEMEQMRNISNKQLVRNLVSFGKALVEFDEADKSDSTVFTQEDIRVSDMMNKMQAHWPPKGKKPH